MESEQISHHASAQVLLEYLRLPGNLGHILTILLFALNKLAGITVELSAKLLDATVVGNISSVERNFSFLFKPQDKCDIAMLIA